MRACAGMGTRGNSCWGDEALAEDPVELDEAEVERHGRGGMREGSAVVVLLPLSLSLSAVDCCPIPFLPDPELLFLPGVLFTFDPSEGGDFGGLPPDLLPPDVTEGLWEGVTLLVLPSEEQGERGGLCFPGDPEFAALRWKEMVSQSELAGDRGRGKAQRPSPVGLVP
mmetsp:Transcript_6891/g.13561  ORF Transcript_6891/g.13561 Transcript_6891/m.13561 type:complete len:168 (-) Transcript_6891:273-776(-)